MKKLKFLKRVIICALVLSLAPPFTSMAQAVESNITPQTAYLFKQEELDQMLAPIALYPDALLAQILSASTYPLEVVAAARFLKANEGSSAEALLEAAKDKDWDPSVKALLEFPGVLAMMDEQIEWTSKLGDAFLAQKSDVMDSVQRLREKAYAAGNLNTTQEQVVIVEPQTRYIIIEPAAAEVVYVPVYDPAIIYGVWWYPAYPPYYFYPRRYDGIYFLTGVFVGAFWGWGAWGCDWHDRDVFVDVTCYNTFTRNHYRRPEHYRPYSGDRREQPWQHDPQHRKGAGYRDFPTAQRFGTAPRVEPKRNLVTPVPTVKPQVNVTPLPSIKRNAAVRGKSAPSKNEVKPEPRAQTVTRPVDTAQRTPNLQRRETGGDKTPRTTPANNDVRPVVTQTTPNIQRQQPVVNKTPRTNPVNNNVTPVVRQSTPNVQRQQPVVNRTQRTSPMANFQAVMKQSISNFKEKVNATPRFNQGIGRGGGR